MNRNYQPQTKQANIKRFTGKFSCYSHNLAQVNVDVILHDEGNQSNLALAVLSKRNKKEPRYKTSSDHFAANGDIRGCNQLFPARHEKGFWTYLRYHQIRCGVPQTFTHCVSVATQLGSRSCRNSTIH